MKPTAEQALEFFSSWNTRVKFCEEFGLSFQESIHLLNWLLKAKFLMRKEVSVEEANELGLKKRGALHLYKRCDKW